MLPQIPYISLFPSRRTLAHRTVFQLLVDEDFGQKIIDIFSHTGSSGYNRQQEAIREKASSQSSHSNALVAAHYH